MNPLSYSDMAHELRLMVMSKLDWLSRFSDGKIKRPGHEIETKRRELGVLQQAQADYEKAAGKAA